MYLFPRKRYCFSFEKKHSRKRTEEKKKHAAKENLLEVIPKPIKKKLTAKMEKRNAKKRLLSPPSRLHPNSIPPYPMKLLILTKKAKSQAQRTAARAASASAVRMRSLSAQRSRIFHPFDGIKFSRPTHTQSSSHP